MAAAASHGLYQAQTAPVAVPEPQNRYFTRFSRSPPASSGCAQLLLYAIKAPAAGAATRAARASLPGPWAVCMLLWARPRSPIADPLLYLGPCRPHLPSPRYFADFPPMLRSYPLRARSAGPPHPRFRSYCGRRIELLSMIIRACLCCTSQGAAGGSGMPTPVCSCGDMWRGS